ncbi:hypothetical protein ACIA8C_04735 [Nocardia sp. NPDC051321]|uniref:hypothetical protein n=1 Tax=Nocardia sp. NPDC051321 TaxID=3364323 RepID=UPI0037A925AE
MGERVVQFPRDMQPLLVRAVPGGLLAGAFGFLGAPLGLAQCLTGRTGSDQPRQLQRAACLGECPAHSPIRMSEQHRERQREYQQYRTRYRD